MPIKKIAQIGIKINLLDILSGYQGIFKNSQKDFQNLLADYFSSKYIYFTNSGTCAFYLILSTLKKISSKKEVILPAYTAPAVVLAVLKAGLKVVLCDISLKDFNLDLELLLQKINPDTLCVVPTHLFGIVNLGIDSLKEKIPQVYIIEDCAQSFGSKIKEKHTGTFSDVAFLSFNRGKNLPTYGGGCIITNSLNLKESIEEEIEKLEKQNIFFKFFLPFKIFAFSQAMKPFIYGALYPVIAKFKDQHVPEDFSLRKFTNFQAGVGLSLFKRILSDIEKRYLNGMFLLKHLSQIKEIILPYIPQDSQPAFSRFPLLFKNLELKEKVKKALEKSGIDTSYMYLRPLHHIFPLGYQNDDFPNANYLAKHLLVLPVHPLVKEEDLLKMVKIINKICFL